MFAGGGLIFVVPFLSIDFLIAQKRMKSPNTDQHICGPDKESDKRSHDKWYLREGYQISWWVLKNFHVENKRYQKKGRHDKIKNISGTWGKRGRWRNATVVFETTLKVILSMLIFFSHGVCSFYWNLHYLHWTLKVFKLRCISSVFFHWNSDIL